MGILSWRGDLKRPDWSANVFNFVTKNGRFSRRVYEYRVYAAARIQIEQLTTSLVR